MKPIKLNKGEIICPECNGLSYINKEMFDMNILFVCRKCMGEGKLDWVNNLTRQIEYYNPHSFIFKNLTCENLEFKYNDIPRILYPKKHMVFISEYMLLRFKHFELNDNNLIKEGKALLLEYINNFSKISPSSLYCKILNDTMIEGGFKLPTENRQEI